MKKAVITAAGGVSALESWLRRQVKNCQWTHSDYHHHELVPFRHSTGVIIACWHCDNELKNQTEHTLDQLVGVNNADWVIDTARIALGLDAQRSLSLAELCWWAVGAGIGDEITEEMARRSLRIKDDGIKSVYRESEIVPSVPATSILSPRIEKAIRPTAKTTPGKPLVPVNVDPVAPATLFARPKRSRWLSADFISWVKNSRVCAVGSLQMMPIILLAGAGRRRHQGPRYFYDPIMPQAPPCFAP